MKQYLIITLLILAACTPQTVTKENVTAKANLSITQVLDEFDALDAQYNTTWREEQIPKKIIRPEALQSWTSHVLALRNITEKNTLAYELLEARLDMLSAQTAIYLGVEVGEKGSVPLKKEGEEYLPGKLNCANAEDMAKTTRLYQMAFHNYLYFAHHMDKVLEKSVETRERIGVNKERMPFYQSSFQDAVKKIEATAKAVKEQCGVTIKLAPEPEMPAIPQHGVIAS